MTITTAPLDLFETQEQCIDAASNAFKDYKSTMEKVVESWLKNELGTIEQLAEAINRSPKTLKTDYVSALRKQGRLPQARTGSATHKSSRSSRKKKVAGNPASPVKSSDPEIEQVQVVVEDLIPEPKPTPKPTPSVPSAGSSTLEANQPVTPTGKLNKSMKVIVKRERISGKLRMKAVAELSQLKEDLEKTWTTAQRERTKLGASIHAKDVEIAEKQLVRDGDISICKSLTEIEEKAEAVRKAARQALYHLHFVDMP